MANIRLIIDDTAKYLFRVDPQQQTTIRSFLKMVAAYCRLPEKFLQLSWQGFHIPPETDARVLKQTEIYRISLSSSSSPTLQLHSTKITQQFHPLKDLEKHQLADFQHQSVGQKQKAKQVRKRKIQVNRQQNHAKKKQQARLNSSQSPSLVSPQKPKISKSNRKNIQKAIDRMTKTSKAESKKTVKYSSSSSQSSLRSSSSESSQEPKRISKGKQHSGQQNPKKNQLQTKKGIKQSKQIKEANQKGKIGNYERPATTSSLPKVVKISLSSEDSSEKDSISKPSKNLNKPKLPLKLRSSIGNQVNQKLVKSSNQNILNKRNQKVNENSKNQVKTSFATHQQKQWVNVTVNNLKESLRQPIQVGNYIRFKIMELDEEKFVPVESEWIEGHVKQIKNKNQFLLQKCKVNGNYLNNYQIRLCNMLHLQNNSNYMTASQLKFLKNSNQTNSIITKPTANQTGKKINWKGNILKTDKKEYGGIGGKTREYSLQNFVCGQLNYYFSDKNYQTDMIMQLHANKDPQKWMPLSFMLNFPKIKKVLRDSQKLLQFILLDQKRAQRTYEIDADKMTIRKRQEGQLKTSPDEKPNAQKQIPEQKQHQGQELGIQRPQPKQNECQVQSQARGQQKAEEGKADGEKQSRAVEYKQINYAVE